MNCFFELKLSSSDVIAIIAFLVSGLSALYARWSWHESKKSNFISLLGERRETHRAFIELKHHMSQKGRSAERTEVGKFYWPNKMASLYFPKEITQDLDKYYDACHWIAYYNMPGEEKTNDEKNKLQEYSSIERELSKKLEVKINNFLQQANA